jgi:squalene-hopene/tetraprenyl-beta-curcumene cyclase
MNTRFKNGKEKSALRSNQVNGLQQGVFADISCEQSLHTGSHDLLNLVHTAISKTRAFFLAQRNGNNYWWFELESNVTVTAEYLMLLHFLGLKDQERDRKIANHILRHQRIDGTWAIHWGGRGDLSTTVESYFALKIAGLSENDTRLKKAREFILAQGGAERTRVFTKIFLALFGECDWGAIPSMPVEIIYLPPSVPLNIYDFSSWARATIVPLLVVLDVKPVRNLEKTCSIQELYREPGKTPKVTSSKKIPLFSWKRAFLLLDRLIKTFEDSPLRILRKKALLKTEQWIIEHQESTGDWAGIQPAMVNSLLALSSLGYDNSFEKIRKGLRALERFLVEDQNELRLQACVSPQWDTAITCLALLHSNLQKEHPAILDSCRWLASRQVFKKGDWSLKKPELEPGGWSFEFENTWYPDVDDTAVILMLLWRYRDAQIMNPENLQKGINWILGMQSKDGGWGAFDADNNRKILNNIPFGDLEALIDPSTPDLTGRALEILGLAGYGLSNIRVQKAINFIQKKQGKDGTWWGRWGVNYLYGTWSVLMGLCSVGENMNKPYVQKAVTWLKINVNQDDGWGECCESYESIRFKANGRSTASQTAWAIMALIAAGEGTSEEVIRGIRYLVNRQRDDGTWDEEDFTGTGFPKHFMIRYHNYRNCFPLMALGMFISQFSAHREKQ